MPHAPQRDTARALLDAEGVEVALFSDPHSVAWLSGLAPPLQVGPTPFLGNPAYLVLAADRATLLVQDAHRADASPLDDDPDIDVVAYPGFTVERPLALQDNAVGALLAALDDAVLSGRPLGVERRALAHPAWAALDARFGRLRSVDDLLVSARMRKTDEEVAALRAAFALTDHAHGAAREAAVPGAREIDVWAAVEGAVQRRAGRRVPIGNDCVVGARENNIGGWPGEHVLETGGSLVVDLGVRPGAYWTDSCATLFPAPPTPRQAALYRAVRGALDHAVSLVRPGLLASDLDRRVRAFLEAAGHPVYPHHTGHGVGVSLHEEPRIVPYNDLPLEAGMVLMLEPGVYHPGEIGVRLEHALLVTDDGAEVLTRHLPEA